MKVYVYILFDCYNMSPPLGSRVKLFIYYWYTLVYDYLLQNFINSYQTKRIHQNLTREILEKVSV